MQPKFSSIAIVGLAAALCTCYASAEDAGRLTARGAAYALVVSEKCSGKNRPIEEVTRRQRSLFVNLQHAGYDFDEIKAGYLEGAMIAESRYQGQIKPPGKECKDAARIKQGIDQLPQ